MDNFWEKIDIRTDEECWPWLKGKTAKGYGSFWRDGEWFRAHRIALELSKGKAPAKSMYALHSCDNPSCCNPSHLRWGTQDDNMKDAVLRKRNAFGENAPNRIINEEIASKIMAMRLEGWKVPEIASLLSLPESLVMGVYTGRSWAHLHGVNGNPTLERLKQSRARRGAAHNRLLSDAMVDRILAGRVEGLTCRDLAEELGMKEGTVSPVFSGKVFTERHGKYGNPTTEALLSVRTSRKALTFDETTEVIRLLNAGYTGDSIAKKYGIGRATVSRIRASVKT